MGDREESGTKVFIGNVEGISEGELRDEFARYGRLTQVWIARNPPGFAFVWFSDIRDAEDAVRGLDGSQLNGKPIRVEISHNRRGRRDRDDRDGRGGGYGDRDRGYDRGGGYSSRPPPRAGGAPRKTGFKVRISNLPANAHWTELKDFMRKVGDIIYANAENGEGVAEFADRDGMERAYRELHDTTFGDRRIVIEMNDESDRYRRDSRSPPPRRGRSRTPPRRGGGRSRSPPPYRSRSRSPRY